MTQSIPVYGSVEDITPRLKATGIKSLSIKSPLQYIFSSENGSSSIIPKNLKEISSSSRDISFIISDDKLTDGDIEEIVTLLGVERAPLEVFQGNGKDSEDREESSSEEDIFSQLESDISTENFIKDLTRGNDIEGRLSDLGEDSFATIVSKDSVLGEVIPEGCSIAYLVFQKSTISDDGGNSPIGTSSMETYDGTSIGMSFDTDEIPLFFMPAVKMSYKQNEDNPEAIDAKIESDGDHIVLSSSFFNYSIESFNPGLLTVIGIPGPQEGKCVISSWFVHSDHMIPAERNTSEGVISNIINMNYADIEEANSEAIESIGVLSESIGELISISSLEFRTGSHISAESFPLVKSIFDEKVSEKIISSIMEL